MYKLLSIEDSEKIKTSGSIYISTNHKGKFKDLFNSDITIRYTKNSHTPNRYNDFDIFTAKITGSDFNGFCLVNNICLHDNIIDTISDQGLIYEFLHLSLTELIHMSIQNGQRALLVNSALHMMPNILMDLNFKILENNSSDMKFCLYKGIKKLKGID